MYPTRRLQTLLNATVLAMGLAIAPSVTAQIPPPPSAPEESPAQTSYPACQPPSRNEYLLLVMSSTPESQDQVRRTIPANAKSTVCNYLNDLVTRVSGFTTLDTANAWARYLTESGLSAFVARPSEVTAAPTPSPNPPTASATTPAATPPRSTAAPSPIAFNPKPLGTGYAVLVDFFSKPEVAAQVQQQLGKDVGLVSYRQRPYLLAIYTTDQAAANSILRTLTDRGFWAMVVDSRRVTLLRSVIDLQRSVVSN